MARTSEKSMTTTRKQSMQLALQKVRAGAVRHVPILSWARSYPAAWLRPDLISAATGWGLMVPVAIAYAGIGGRAGPGWAVHRFRGPSGLRDLRVRAAISRSRPARPWRSCPLRWWRRWLPEMPPRPMGLTAALALIVGIYLVVGRHPEARVHLRFPGQVSHHRVRIRIGAQHHRGPVAQGAGGASEAAATSSNRLATCCSACPRRTPSRPPSA